MFTCEHTRRRTVGLSCRRCWNACKSWNASWDAKLSFHTLCSKRQEAWQMDALKHINHLPLWADKHLVLLMTPEDQNKRKEIKTGRGGGGDAKKELIDLHQSFPRFTGAKSWYCADYLFMNIHNMEGKWKILIPVHRHEGGVREHAVLACVR